MIDALRDIGIYSFRKKRIDTSNNLIEILVDEVNKGGNYSKAYAINFIEDAEGLRYRDVNIEDWDKGKKLRYLYREKGTQGAHYTPTARIAGSGENEVRKTFDNRIKKWFERLRREHSHWLEKSTLIKSLFEAYTKDKDRIETDLVNLRMQYNDGGFITFIIYKDGEKRYLGDIKDFVNYLEEFSKEDYNEVSGKGVCSLCRSKGKVYGDAFPITIYTLDKPGYIAGGMRKENGYKNFPICFECVLQLKEGIAYMRETLEFRFAGLRYYLIPQVAYNKDYVLDEIMSIYRSFKQETGGNVSLSKAERIAADEDDILGVLKDFEDKVTLKFLFFQEISSKFVINMLMEDILPSRIRTLFNAKRRAEEHLIFKDIKSGANKVKDIKYHYGLIKDFIPSVKSFLEVVNKSFKGQKIDKQYIFEMIMDRLRGLFNSNTFMKTGVLQAFICLIYLNELGLFKNFGGEHNLMEKYGEVVVASDLSSRINEFFEEFGTVFNTSAKKAVFLTGVLAQHLLAIQKNDRGSMPFRSQLKGLKLSERDVKALLPKIQQKLEEYKKNYYVQLEKIISLYYLRAGEGWSISIDELNFYFVLGMNLRDAVNKNGIPYFKVKEDGQDEQI